MHRSNAKRRGVLTTRLAFYSGFFESETTMHIAAWELLDAATVTRKQLLRGGFRPLPAIGKAIAVPGWTDIAATEGIIDNWSRQFPEALNTGALTRNTPVIDVDITDEAAATAVEFLAREQFEERGRFLV